MYIFEEEDEFFSVVSNSKLSWEQRNKINTGKLKMNLRLIEKFFYVLPQNISTFSKISERSVKSKMMGWFSSTWIYSTKFTFQEITFFVGVETLFIIMLIHEWIGGRWNQTCQQHKKGRRHHSRKRYFKPFINICRQNSKDNLKLKISFSFF